MIGKKFSRYQILEKIGEGGMGKVYLAEDTELKRKVAIKMLIPQFTSDEEVKIRFKREAQAAAALNHPNIITIYEVGESEWGMFIAMEFVEGKCLKNYIEEDKLSIPDALEFAVQICEGINEAHQAGIIHRDIKSDNIIINDKGRAKILDFGLAKLKQASTITKKSATLGTLQYMSPEQINNENVDHRTDIFSFGVVLYEMITGQLPFKGEYEAVIVYSILNEDPEPLARYKTNVTEELQRIVCKALEKNQNMRYQHIDDLLADLMKEKESNIHLKSEKSRKILTTQPAEKPERKLSAIMFTDIVGFSTMMGKNEEETLKLLHDYESIAAPIVQKHDGRILKEIGDGLFCEFKSALKAADCATEIQKLLFGYNESKPDEFKLKVRIGIHMGDVVKKGDDLLGDGVNVAARIEPLAPPGGIYVSEAIFSAISSHPQFQTISLGQRKLKGLSYPHHLYWIKTGYENEIVDAYQMETPLEENIDPSLKKKKDPEAIKGRKKTRFYLLTSLIVLILIVIGFQKQILNILNPAKTSIENLENKQPNAEQIQKFISEILHLENTPALWEHLQSNQNQGKLTYGNKSDFYNLENKIVIILDEQKIHSVLLYQNEKYIDNVNKKVYNDLSAFLGNRVIWVELFNK